MVLFSFTYLVLLQTSNVDGKTIEEINKIGGIQGIALSHPHYYSAQIEWAEAFDCNVYIHESDRQWVQRSDRRIVFWEGETLSLSENITLYRLGGHFECGTLLFKVGNDNVLLTGDIIQVVADRNWVSFMYSYPNLIPLPASKVGQMARIVEPLKFERLYNAFHRIVKNNADEVVQRSAKRYIKALSDRDK